MERRARLLILLFISAVCLFLAVEIYWYNIYSYSNIPTYNINVSADELPKITNSKSIQITQTDNGKAIFVKKGYNLSIELPTSKYPLDQINISGDGVLVIVPNNKMPIKGYFIENFAAVRTGSAGISDGEFNVLINVTN